MEFRTIIILVSFNGKKVFKLLSDFSVTLTFNLHMSCMTQFHRSVTVSLREQDGNIQKIMMHYFRDKTESWENLNKVTFLWKFQLGLHTKTHQKSFFIQAGLQCIRILTNLKQLFTLVLVWPVWSKSDPLVCIWHTKCHNYGVTPQINRKTRVAIFTSLYRDRKFCFF